MNRVSSCLDVLSDDDSYMTKQEERLHSYDEQAPKQYELHLSPEEITHILNQLYKVELSELDNGLYRLQALSLVQSGLR